MRALLIALSILVVGCGEPDRLNYAVNCGACRVKYSVGDSVLTVNVQKEWHTFIRVRDGQLFGIHVDSISGEGMAYCHVALGKEIEYVNTCLTNEGCVLEYLGEAKLPWWAR